jgi:PAS domain S-box-containing protein
MKISKEIKTNRGSSKKGERYFRVLIENSGEGIGLLDVNGNIIYASPSSERITGYTEKELTGTNAFEYIHPADLQYVKDNFNNLIRKPGEVITVVHRYIYKGGSLRWSETTGTNMIANPDIRGIILSFHDITKGKRIEEELQLLKALTYTIVKSKDFISALEVTIRKVCESTGWIYGEAWVPSANGIYLECSRAWYSCEGGFEKFRKGSEEFRFPLGVGLPGRVWASKKPNWISDVTLNYNFPRRQLAMKIGLKSAVAIPIIADNKVVAVLDFLTYEVKVEDEKLIELISAIASQLGIVFKRKQAENLLIESEGKLKNIMESVPVGIAVTNPEGKVIEINSTVIKMLGYDSREEFIKIPVINHYNNLEDRGQFIRLLQENSAVKDFEVQFKRKDGTLILCSINSMVQDTERGVEFINTYNDITERKRLEAQVCQSQKIEAIGQLTGGIAHDFNNILTAIIGFASILKMKMKRDDPLMVNTDYILESARKAADLTRNLLAFSRKQIICLKQVNLNDIMADAMKLLKRVIRENIELKINIIDEGLTVMADSVQIEQVLLNLATNARDAMPHGGVLTIEVSSTEIDDKFINTHGYGKAGRYALITVKDTGFGMDEGIQNKIFEPFFTTKEVGEGTGLGLSIVYGIVKQHEGYINVYSKPGKGTTFRIYLLLIEPKIKYIKPREDTVPTPASRGETILIADDDDDIRNIIIGTLKDYGYKVIEAIDGEDALEKFKENRDKIALVILDVIMPKKDGKDTYDEIINIKPDIKVLFISGYTADAIESKEITEKGLNFIQKPFTPIDILKKIREILE